MVKPPEPSPATVISRCTLLRSPIKSTRMSKDSSSVESDKVVINGSEAEVAAMEEKKAKTMKEKKKEGLMLRMGRRAVENLRLGRRRVKKFRATKWHQLMLPRKFMVLYLLL
ncbi:hypothetical protein V6N12_047935 [Hibiscus sabdariffa]|uniref:Uncharacterized protein n=1 Tax=Hibiscus sabdariffa TaxID=183260 RepID=A0ABR2CUF5_9ROSI